MKRNVIEHAVLAPMCNVSSSSSSLLQLAPAAKAHPLPIYQAKEDLAAKNKKFCSKELLVTSPKI